MAPTAQLPMGCGEQRENGNQMSAENGLVASMPSTSVAEEVATLGTAAVLGMIPGVGGLLAAGVSGPMVILAKLEQEKWLLELAAAVDGLVAQRRLTYDEILSDTRFRAAATQATRIASETARVEKLRLLANATSNSGCWSNIEQTHTPRFLRVLERYDPEHLLMLKAMHDPTRMLNSLPDAPDEAALHIMFSSLVYPDLDDAHTLGDIVLRELESDGFLNAGYGLGASLTRDEHGQMTSPLGAKFLDFCSGNEIATASHT